MSHTSPATYLIWSILSCMLWVFLLYHLWSFDRFRCLRWNSGPYSGAFKRIMTYSYLLCIPLLMTYAIGNAIIKYHEGFMAIPFHGILPKPYQLWEPALQRFIFPLTLCFSIAWSLELVTHLEELCFWLYLINSTSRNQDWFKTLYFKTWVVGSIVAIIYMPLVTILSRSDNLKSEAYTFLAGSLGSLSVTVWFLPVLYLFPSFLRTLKSSGVDTGTIIRLTKFDELNRIRVLFRFFFCVPLLVLGIDGSRPHDHHINESMLWTDILAVLSGVGVTVSSGITLVIFFPRSIKGEIATKDGHRRKYSHTGHSASRHVPSYITSHGPHRNSTYMPEAHPISQPHFQPGHNEHSFASVDQSAYHSHSLPSNIRRHSFENPFMDDNSHYDLKTLGKMRKEEETDVLPPIRPNRRRGADVELGGFDAFAEGNSSAEETGGLNVNPLIHGFTSPINLYSTTEQVEGITPRYTFRKQ